MKILAIDTSSKICSCAILENEDLIDEINLDNGRTHSENLLPIMSELLEKNNINLKEIDLIACSVGPGSFTGIRIGVSSIKAMAEVHNIKIAEVTSLETLARIDEAEYLKVSMIDARNNQVYCGIFDKDYNKLQDYMADDINNVLEILKEYDNMIFIGDGAILHKEKIVEIIPNAIFSIENEQKAFYVGKIGYKKFLNNDLKNANTILPIYLRKSQAERLKRVEK